uniref:Uncharacterized protein n=1 Tax=Anguilla anguilla TaxID=7936 RepID=A0A0E9QCL9_ANGAN
MYLFMVRGSTKISGISFRGADLGSTCDDGFATFAIAALYFEEK